MVSAGSAVSRWSRSAPSLFWISMSLEVPLALENLHRATGGQRSVTRPVFDGKTQKDEKLAARQLGRDADHARAFAISALAAGGR